MPTRSKEFAKKKVPRNSKPRVQISGMKLRRVTQGKHIQQNKLGTFYSNPASTCWCQPRSHRNSLKVTTQPLTQQLTWKPATRKVLPAWSKRISLCCSVQNRPHLLVRTSTAAAAFLLSLGPGSKTHQAASRISSTQAFQLYNPIVFISWLIIFGLNGLPVGHSFQGWATTCLNQSHTEHPLNAHLIQLQISAFPLPFTKPTH